MTSYERKIVNKPWTPAQWVEGEIQDMIDGYGNSDWEAAQFVRDLLNGDEYHDELTEGQRQAALKYIRERIALAIDEKG